jgi:poly-gamma-glutamate capsule biosynthesis protein CapA/YwtB (metallophosphatase superfamily)
MDIKIGELYVSQKHERLHPHTLVNVYPNWGLSWKVFPSHVTAASAERCRGLTLVYP